MIDGASVILKMFDMFRRLSAHYSRLADGIDAILSANERCKLKVEE